MTTPIRRTRQAMERQEVNWRSGLQRLRRQTGGSLTAASLKRAEQRIRRRIKVRYPITAGSRLLFDGVVNSERYVRSPLRLVWYLNEPYDVFDPHIARDEPTLSVTTLLTNPVHGPFYRPSLELIREVSEGIWHRVAGQQRLPGKVTGSQTSPGLTGIAIVYAKKLLGPAPSDSGGFMAGYMRCRHLLFTQFIAYRPHVIFVCSPNGGMIAGDFSADHKNPIAFGNHLVLRVSRRLRLVGVDPPARITNTLAQHVSEAVEAATADLPMTGSGPEPCWHQITKEER